MARKKPVNYLTDERQASFPTAYRHAVVKMCFRDGNGYDLVLKWIKLIHGLVGFDHGGSKPITNSYFDVS